MCACHPANSRARQNGAALPVTLMMLAVVMLLGVTAMQTSLLSEKASRNHRDRQIAFHAAEAALRDAALDLASTPGRNAAFPNVVGECRQDGLAAGLCLTGGLPLWPGRDFLVTAPSIEFGRFTGRRFPHGAASLSAQPPRYLVELVELQNIKGTATGATNFRRYRITAIGFGTRVSAQVVLQNVLEVVHNNGNTIGPGRLLSWREIGNWQEVSPQQ